ncbi:MAG: hypothetical protein C0423_15370 [Methylibium sp.]|nr:hypothetical protein [Methylibium sp.]
MTPIGDPAELVFSQTAATLALALVEPFRLLPGMNFSTPPDNCSVAGPCSVKLLSNTLTA